jgi:hypothetical protein
MEAHPAGTERVSASNYNDARLPYAGAQQIAGRHVLREVNLFDRNARRQRSSSMTVQAANHRRKRK